MSNGVHSCAQGARWYGRSNRYGFSIRQPRNLDILRRTLSKWCMVAACAVLASVLASSVNLACSATLVGSVGGEFDVSSTGASMYTIPITLPPGTAGVQPKLAITYSSQSGNGILGMGWSVSGLSAISRCKSTIAQDGQAGAITLTASDRFCLDGQRLVLVRGTSYGAVGAEYRTEIETFSKVVSYDGIAGSPAYFKIWTKSGQIIEYGNTQDSRLAWQVSGPALSWAANKVTDTVGNYITFSYSLDRVKGEQHISHIDYTGNGPAALNPYSAVDFLYEARPDGSFGYNAGFPIQQTQRLAHIRTSTGGATVMDYAFTYEAGTTTGRSRLVAVSQCAANGDCLPSTTFAWQEGEGTVFGPAIETARPSVMSSWPAFAVGDVNADGRADVLLADYDYPAPSPKFLLYLAQVDGSLVNSSVTTAGIDATRLFLDYQIGSIHFDTLTLADSNADGFADAFACATTYPDNGDFAWFRLKWSSDQGQLSPSPLLAKVSSLMGPVPFRIGSYACRSIDTDGSGKSEMNIAAWSDVGEVFLNFTDIDGDKKSDLVNYNPASGKLYLTSNYNFWTLFSQPMHELAIEGGGSTLNRWLGTGDVNGDGLSDIVVLDSASGQLKVWLSRGNLSISDKITSAFVSGGDRSSAIFSVLDINGDGLADAIQYRPQNGELAVAISRGDGTFGSSQLTSIGAGFADSSVGHFQIADVNGDGLLDMVIHDSRANTIKVSLAQGTIPDLLISVTNGFRATTTFAYKPLTNSEVYAKGTSAVYPDKDLAGPLYVVANVSSDNGAGDYFRETHTYVGARMNLHGRGLLGFASHRVRNDVTGNYTDTFHRLDYPYIGLPYAVRSYSSLGTLVSATDNNYDFKSPNSGKTRYPYISKRIETIFDLYSHSQISQTTTDNSFDNDGNAQQITVTSSDGITNGNWVKTTVNYYDPTDTTNWILGRLNRTEVTSRLPGGTQQTRVSAFEYGPATGLLTKETIEPDQPQYRLDTAYAYDAYGNRTAATVSSPATGTAAIATRSTSTTYDTKGQFPEIVSNALGHAEHKTFDARFGSVATLTGPNNLTTTWQYDDFGRKKTETRADGTQTIWTYDVCDAACPANGVYRIVTQEFAPGGVQSAPVSVSYFNRLNRAVRAATQGFDGRWIYKDTEYDGHGNVARTSRPYYVGDTIYWTVNAYDNLNRLVQVIEPDNFNKPALVVEYNGLTITRTNRKNQTTSETRNSQGQKVSVTDALGQAVVYGYDPFGNLQYVTNSGGSLESLATYDIRGRKVWNYTPDMGSWNYEYDALGELTKQTDAKNQITSFVYDTLGRMTQRVEPGLTSTWTWDSAAYGIGKLQSAQTSAGYIRSHWYDDKGRPQLILSNLGAGNPLFFASFTYDAAGRISQQYLSSGITTKRIYNSLGYETELRNADRNVLYWQLNAMDAESHIIQETYGNGTAVYTTYLPTNGRFNYRIDNRNGAWIDYYYQGYDDLGNINSRYHMGGGGGDNLTYDALNRLTQTERFGNAAGIDTIVYAPGGNIRSKTSVGDYYYGGNVNCAAGSNGGIHAVCKAGSNTYAYDANGNLTGGGGRSLTWTPWNMPASLTQGGQTTTWLYGPEHDRYKMTASGRTTWYLNPGIHQGGHYEYTRYANDTYESRTTLYGGGRPIGEIVGFDGSPKQVRYFHSDAQGSITAVTDSAGTVLTRYRYDPWGKLTLVSGSNTGIDQTRQGHTGHEMLDGGLTHMNGRLYDPLISRFVSADPYVDNPFDLQSLNRYSYVLNNPLIYTDPSGYSCDPTGQNDTMCGPVFTLPAITVTASSLSGFDYYYFDSWSSWTAPTPTPTWSSNSTSANWYDFGNTLSSIDKHFNGSLAKFAAAVGGYSLISKDTKYLYNECAHQDCSGVRLDSAQSLADSALQDRRLSLSEANEIWRANTDPNFELTVDAGQLTVKQLSEYGVNGTAGARVTGADWLVHGSVTLSRDSSGNILILPGAYDFQSHGTFWNSPVRNFETYLGFYVGSRAGTSPGVDYFIRYSGHPNVVR